MPEVLALTGNSWGECLDFWALLQVLSYQNDLTLIGDYWGWYDKRFYHHTGMISMTYAMREALEVVKVRPFASRMPLVASRLPLVCRSFASHLPLVCLSFASRGGQGALFRLPFSATP